MSGTTPFAPPPLFNLFSYCFTIPYARRHTPPDPTHNRSPGQRDRDRILYTDALQRLANVTQVASPGEGIVFHNRLTHTHEVAQIARRLAEKLLEGQRELAEQLGGLDPDVVEAAALAHDLGHPPFGHIAENELDLLARAHNAPEGFEGNAHRSGSSFGPRHIVMATAAWI